jgi:hypothetical protein
MSNVRLKREEPVSRGTRLVAIIALYLILVPIAWGNTGVPGPLMHYGSSLSVSPWQWIVVTMSMCIGVEAAVYRYSRQYKRPLCASVYANFITLVLGIPLGLLGAVDPTWFVLPTLASIVLEYWAIRGRKGWFETAPGAITASPIIWGNLLSNAILVGLLFVAMKKQ